jgi:hypothetical protein
VILQLRAEVAKLTGAEDKLAPPRIRGNGHQVPTW